MIVALHNALIWLKLCALWWVTHSESTIRYKDINKKSMLMRSEQIIEKIKADLQKGTWIITHIIDNSVSKTATHELKAILHGLSQEDAWSLKEQML